jgi:hypothetical protein
MGVDAISSLCAASSQQEANTGPTKERQKLDAAQTCASNVHPGFCPNPKGDITDTL